MTITALPMADVRNRGFLPQAIVARSIERLSDELRVPLEAGSDDLDAYQGVALALDHGRMFTLKHYRGHPPETATIYLPTDVQQIGEITETIAEMIRGLGLGEEAVIWRRADNPEL